MPVAISIRLIKIDTELNLTGKEPLNPIDIQYLLKRKVITQAALAKKHGVSAMSMSDVINFRRISRRLMQAVAGEVEMQVEKVFAWSYENPDRPVPVTPISPTKRLINKPD